MTPMKNALGVSPSKGNQGTTRGKEKNSFDLGGNRTHDLRTRFTVGLPTKLRGRTENENAQIYLPRVVPWFPLLRLTPSAFFMGFT